MSMNWSQKVRAQPPQQPSYSLNQPRTAPQQPQQSGYGQPPQNYNNRGQPQPSYDNRGQPRYTQRPQTNNNPSQSSQQPVSNQSLSKTASQIPSNKTSVSAQTDNNVNINNVASNPTDNIVVDQSQQNVQNAPDVIPNVNDNNVNKTDVNQVPQSAVTQSQTQSISTQQSQVDNKQNEDTLGADTSDHQSLASGTTPKKKPYSQSSINNKMLFGTRYEVKCDETFAYYEGYVFDFDEKEQKLRVAYPWKSDQLVPVNYVRPLAPAVDPNWKPKQGDHVECQAKAEESEPYGWWDCTIKTVRDNLYLITYEGWDNHHEVLQHNMLRPYNDQEPFEDEEIVRELLPLKSDKIQEFKSSADLSNQSSLQSFMNPTSSTIMSGLFGNDKENKSATTMEQLRRITKQTNLIHLNFSPEQEKLLLIGTKKQVSDAKMLINFVWNLRESYRKKEEQVKQDEKLKQKEYDELKKCVSVRFKFHVALTKYVIGTKGENIQNAKKLEGVKHINVRNLNETESECLILATDQEGANDARAILEMEQGSELIPADPNLRKELIGRDGHNIQQLEKRSHVIKICTLDHLRYIQQSSQSYYNRNNYQPSQSFIDEEESTDNNLIKLIIIGPKEKVPFAKMLIKSQVALIQEKFALLERSKQARKDYHGDDYYEYNNNDNNNGGNQSQSTRRQRKRKEQTQQSSKDTTHYNYTNAPRGGGGGGGINPIMDNENNNDPEFPSLGTKAPHKGGINDQNMGQDEEEEDIAEVSWLEHDENDDDTYGHDHDQQNESHGGRGRGVRYDGGGYDNGESYQDQPPRPRSRGGGYNKQRGRSGGRGRGRGNVWKPKDKSQNSSQSNQEANTSSNQ